MSQSVPVQRTNAVLIGIFIAALVAHAWLVTRNWTTPFMPGHEFRQAQTAIISYYIDKQDNFSLLYETPIIGKPWISVLMEVPIYEWTVVGLSRWLKIPHYEAARTVSLASFYLALPAVFLLLGRWRLPVARRCLVLALVLLCPVYLFYSRAFLMDSMAFMFCAWFLYGYVQTMDRRRWYWFLLASVAGTGAALVKSATLAIWLWPAAAYAASRLWCDWRARAGAGAFLQTVFWGVAAVVIPLGTLEMWIQLTDPIKEAHASAYIFTSKNLAGGNWGLTDLAARFSPKVWETLAVRWSEAIMAPWLMLSVLGAGLVLLPRVRWPVLALAGVFFWAQVLFPFAYAYQDYYFYSCAIFVVAAYGLLLSGLLDTRAPRWLVWPLLLVPLVGQLATYRGNYYLQQQPRSEGGFPFTRAIRDFLPKGSVIVVAGGDWSAIIPFYSERKALMIRNGLERDAAYLERSFSELADEDVGALVLMYEQRGNKDVVDRAAATFGTDRVISFSSPFADIYCNLRYRDRLKEELRNMGNYDGLLNQPVEPSIPELSRPFRVPRGAAPALFPSVSPSPLRAYFEQGLGYVWVKDQKVVFAHPECDIWIRVPAGATRVEWDYGILAGAHEKERERTDGVEFRITGIGPGGKRREIFSRFLNPWDQVADRGEQSAIITFEPLPGEFLQFSCRPGPGSSFDWAYWKRIDVK